MKSKAHTSQITFTRKSPACIRVSFDNPPLNLMGPEFVREFTAIMNELESDEDVKVVIFESAVDGFFLNHSDFSTKLEDLTALPQGPTGLEAWPDILVRLTRAPFVSIALIRGRATGNGSELALACDMSFASREKAILSQWEVGVGMVAGGGPMARLPRLIGRGRALEVLLSSRGHSGRSGGTVWLREPLAAGCRTRKLCRRTRHANCGFDKWAIANTKRLVNAADMPADVEICGRVGCVHHIDPAAGRAEEDQDADRTRLSKAGRCRKPVGLCPGKPGVLNGHKAERDAGMAALS